MAEHGTGCFGEKPLDEVEPGTVFGGEHKREAAGRLSGQPRLGLLRGVRRVIVQNDLDCSCGWVGSVEDFEELDELATAMAVPGLRRGRLLTSACTVPVSKSMPAIRVTVPWRLYSWSRCVVGWVPGTGERSGVVLPIA